MAPLDRLERLTDLVLVLLNASRPLTLDEIAREVPGYPGGHDARRQAFERDKRLLRDEGIPVVTEPVDGPEQSGYRIDPDAFYLPDLRLSPDEQAALHLAVAGVHLGDPSGRDALAKLGATGLARPGRSRRWPRPQAFVPLFDAVRVRRRCPFDYRGAERHVAPAASGSGAATGTWSAGTPTARRRGRFRVDRIEGPADRRAEPGAACCPTAFDAATAASRRAVADRGATRPRRSGCSSTRSRRPG